jgi:hypothetical protein
VHHILSVVILSVTAPLQRSLIFVGKARSLPPSGATLMLPTRIVRIVPAILENIRLCCCNDLKVTNTLAYLPPVSIVLILQANKLEWLSLSDKALNIFLNSTFWSRPNHFISFMNKIFCSARISQLLNQE